MALVTQNCPNCGASYNPAKYQCEYCGSYIFMTNDNFKDLSDIKIELPKQKQGSSDKYPGIYVFGRLLGQGERPITLGSANYFTGMTSAGGKLLLTNKSLSFSAHGVNVGRKEQKIELKDITNVELGSNFLISQNIVITENGRKHKFVVYHGKEWIQKIKEAIAKKDEVIIEEETTTVSSSNYVEELKQLKELLDMGIITEDEFAIKKRQLLNL